MSLPSHLPTANLATFWEFESHNRWGVFRLAVQVSESKFTLFKSVPGFRDSVNTLCKPTLKPYATDYGTLYQVTGCDHCEHWRVPCPMRDAFYRLDYATRIARCVPRQQALEEVRAAAASEREKFKRSEEGGGGVAAAPPSAVSLPSPLPKTARSPKPLPTPLPTLLPPMVDSSTLPPPSPDSLVAAELELDALALTMFLDDDIEGDPRLD